jgi:hypothetical protein
VGADSVLIDPHISGKAARFFGVLALRAIGKSTVAFPRDQLFEARREEGHVGTGWPLD